MLKYPLVDKTREQIEAMVSETNAGDFWYLIGNLPETQTIKLADKREPLVAKIIQQANQENNFSWLDSCFLSKEHIDSLNNVFYAALTALSENKISIEAMEAIMLYCSVLKEFPLAQVKDLSDLNQDLLDSLFVDSTLATQELPKSQQFYIHIELTSQFLAEIFYHSLSRIKLKMSPENRFQYLKYGINILLDSMQLSTTERLRYKLYNLMAKETWDIEEKEQFLSFLKKEFPILNMSLKENKDIPSLIPFLIDKQCGIGLFNFNKNKIPVLVISSSAAFRKSIPILGKGEHYLKPLPIVGDLTANDISLIEQQGFRPIQYDHPENPCPKNADGHDVHWSFIFTLHDWYHIGITAYIPNSHADFFCQFANYLTSPEFPGKFKKPEFPGKFKKIAEKLIDLEMRQYSEHDQKVFEIQQAFLNILTGYSKKYDWFTAKLAEFINTYPQCNRRVLSLVKNYLLNIKKINFKDEKNQSKYLPNLIASLAASNRQTPLLLSKGVALSIPDLFKECSSDDTLSPLTSSKKFSSMPNGLN